MRSRNLIAVGAVYLLAGALFMSAQTRTAPVLRLRPVPAPNSARASKSAGKSASSQAPHRAILPAGLPLRVELDCRYRMRPGAPVVGKLIDPVYSGDHIVLPANTIVDGIISRLQPIGRETRTWALLDGDVTPVKRPLLTFTALQLPDGQRLPLIANATERTAGVVKMNGPRAKESLAGKVTTEVKTQVEAKKQSVEGLVHSRHKSDVALKFIFGQLPYHPQDIWAGTQFDAVLARPLTLPDLHPGRHYPITPPRGHIPPGTLDARLLTAISSGSDKVGNPIVAVLTQPYFNASKTRVVLPTGTRLMGVITQAKPARALGRNGTLRFTFRQIKLPGGALQQMHAQMSAVEGTNGQNLTVDSEGGAKANSAQGKFLAPLLLGAMASHSFDSDQGAAEAGAYSNGFGLVARIVGFVAVTPAVSAGFGFYSFGKSITRRWLMPGQNVVFAKNTRMELSVADR